MLVHILMREQMAAAAHVDALASGSTTTSTTTPLDSKAPVTPVTPVTPPPPSGKNTAPGAPRKVPEKREKPRGLGVASRLLDFGGAAVVENGDAAVVENGQPIDVQHLTDQE